jgi:hypothetical protein
MSERPPAGELSPSLDESAVLERTRPSVFSRMRKWLWPDWRLRDAENKAGEKLARGRNLEVLPWSPAASRSIDELVSLVQRVLQAENDRETSLNSRGAAITAVAGIIVSLSGVIADLVLGSTSPNQANRALTGGEKSVAVCIFIAALALLIVAIAIAVLGVLRPGRGKTTRVFLGDALVRMLVADINLSFVRAHPTRLKLLYVDRVLRALPHWHFRNRRKARWLRRAYVILGLGITLIAASVAFAVSRRANVSYWLAAPAFGGALLMAWLIVPTEFVSGTRDEEELPDIPVESPGKMDFLSVEAALKGLTKPWEAPRKLRWRRGRHDFRL